MAEKKKKKRSNAAPKMTAAERAAISARSRSSSTDRDFRAAKAAPKRATAAQARPASSRPAGMDAAALSAFRSMEREFGNRPVTPAGGYTPTAKSGLMGILGSILPQAGAAPAPVAPAEAPIVDVPGGGGGGGGDVGGNADFEKLLEMELAALGPGPDRATYIRPFEEAEGRSRETYNQALPQIAEAYNTLRQQLQTGQQGFSEEQKRIAAEQQTRHGQLAEKVRQLQAPALTDLATQSGGAAAPSLMAGVQGQAQQNEANLADAQRRQAAFLENLARTSEQSAQSRLTDTQGAETAAKGNAAFNLNNILSQLGVQRSNAEARYSADRGEHEQRVAATKIGYMKEQARARQEAAQASQQAAREAARAAQDESKAAKEADTALQKRYRDVIANNVVAGDFAREHSYMSKAPATKAAFLEIMQNVKEPGPAGRSQALTVLDLSEEDISKPDENGAYLYGKPISTKFLRDMIDQYYQREDELAQRYL